MAGRTSSLACLGLVALLLAARPTQDEDGEPPIHERIDRPSLAACGGCHLDVTLEWSKSLHARAWTNANVRTATRNFEKKSCRPCHSPQPVLLSGLDHPPKFRDFNREDGVHCLSCHGLSDGVAATRTIPDAPCRPKHEPRLTQAALCYPCHEPTHGAFEEYFESEAFARGQTCADCHMPERESGGGHSHGPNGGWNEDFVRRAVDWKAGIVARELRVTLRNKTGHKFPGEIPSRSFLLEVTPEDGEAELVTLRKPHRGEGRADDRLTPDEERVLSFPLAEGVSSVRVRLLFRPLPLLPLERCLVIGETVVDVD